MKRIFDISIQSTKLYQVFITGYSKILYWAFHSSLRINMSLFNNTFRLIERFKFSNTISVIMSVPNYFKLIERWNFDSNFKIDMLSILRLTERYKSYFNVDITLTSILRFIERWKLSIRVSSVKFYANMRLAKFYKLRDWDYKIPDQPSTSPKYKLYELDTKSLDEMDGQIF